jgi:hypothetical protein
LQVSSISLELGNNQAVNFKLDMTNASLFGLGETQVRSARFVYTSDGTQYLPYALRVLWRVL